MHDGPGIRTTVFLKGCSLHCPWCSNPENLKPYPEEYLKENKKGVYGKYYSCEKLFGEIIKDSIFFGQTDLDNELGRTCGGVTFSGGEPLLQFDALEPLLINLKGENIHICTETCLFASEGKLEIALKYTDLFYVDIKILDEKKCYTILGGNIKQYYSNLEKLFQERKTVVFRVPVIGGYTDENKNIMEIIKLLKKFRPVRIELIKEHNLGRSKYISLNRKPLDLNKTTNEDMEKIKKMISCETGIHVEICIV